MLTWVGDVHIERGHLAAARGPAGEGGQDPRVPGLSRPCYPYPRPGSAGPYALKTAGLTRARRSSSRRPSRVARRSARTACRATWLGEACLLSSPAIEDAARLARWSLDAGDHRQ